MLQNIRDRATGPVAWFILGLLILLFSLWGIESYFTTAPNPKLAEVGDVEITRADLQQAYDQRYQRLQTLLGENFNHDMIDPKAFRRSVLDDLVQNSLLEQYVDDERYRVGDAQVLAYIKTLPAFQVDGSFSPEAYQAALARQGMNASYYEDQVRAALQVEQLRAGLLESAVVTARDIETHWRLDQQQREVAVLKFDAQKYGAEINPAETEIAARYTEEKNRFVTPERVRLEYVELDRTTLPPAAVPEQALLQALYEAEKQTRFSKPEERQARHILIEVNAQSSDAKAQEEARTLRDQLAKGGDFAALASQHSDDPGSKARGGQLEPATRGVLDPAFEDALFKLKTGEISQPIRSAFGWHIIRLDSISPEKVKPLSDSAVRDEVLTLYREREADERFRQLADKLDELSFEHATSLQPVAQALGLNVQSTDWLAREGGAGIGAIKEVMDTAFSDAMLKDKVNSAPVKAGATRLIVLRVAAHEASRQRPLNEVREEIVAVLKQQGARAKAQKQGQQALAELRKGNKPEAVAASLNGSLERPGFVGRKSDVLAAPVLAELFRMPRPKPDQASYAGVSLGDGSYAALMLTAVQDGNVATLSAQDREAQVQALAGRMTGAEFAAFKQALEKDIDVTVNEDQL